MQITELREAKAEGERQKAALSRELQATRDVLHQRNAMLHRHQCDQQVPTRMLLCSPGCQLQHRQVPGQQGIKPSPPAIPRA